MWQNGSLWVSFAGSLQECNSLSCNIMNCVQVLITKLRSATTPETQQSRKATKAMVVLMPLLGITYILILIGPSRVPLYEHIRAFLISTQVRKDGILVEVCRKTWWGFNVHERTERTRESNVHWGMRCELFAFLYEWNIYEWEEAVLCILVMYYTNRLFFGL
jgi:hypothetical protein